jgi:4'-phosphopantetheinyl transferase EntD
MALMARILAPGLFGAERYDRGQSLSLHPEEERHVAGAAPKRRRDFTLGRACAHAALAEIGRDDGPVLRADDGAPCWPAGLVGSITHTQGYAAALVAQAADFTGLGVDAERLGGVTSDLWPRLFGARERDDLAGRSDPDRAATLIFSAKEACHKAGGERVLRFHDLQVTLDLQAIPADGRFTARRGAQIFEGRFALEGALVLTAAWRA